ncbi:MAG: hypothetical protein K5663_12645 [Clostridiales bacterium]|nr:hypothetical protein [Clostridiales bacterium]
MRQYQSEYIENVREAAALADFGAELDEGFEEWYSQRLAALKRIGELKRRNTQLLNECLFPCLDALHGAKEYELKELSEFAESLLDWKTNLDPGVYTAIHDAMLSLYRVRGDRDAVVRELYKLGMGMYYMDRYVAGLKEDKSAPFRFQNEMVFTEAASYLRCYEEMENEETRGYIVRSTANVALCVRDHKRKIAASSRALKIIHDEKYVSLAPSLPWSRFEQAAHRQMSANRISLSRGDLSDEELAEVLDSCHEVFKSEQASANPGARWLWPYYDMEYSCGYVSRECTLERLEKLISDTPADQYDMNGMYGNVHLVLIYGEILRRHEELRGDLKRLRFLNAANRRLYRTLLNYPADRIDDGLRHDIANVLNNYNETGCEISFKQLALGLTQRYGGELYIRGRLKGEMSKRLCETLLKRDGTFFDDIPFIAALTGENKTRALLNFALECGIFCDIGLVKMGMEEIRTRGLFETEHRMYLLHPVAGSEVLRRNDSTLLYADTALGHESCYDGSEPTVSGYERNASCYRQMTDAVALASFIVERLSQCGGDFGEVLRQIYAAEGTRFSPLIVSALSDQNLLNDLRQLLSADRRPYYKEVYNALRQGEEEGR